jgi:hypothetical protein
MDHQMEAMILQGMAAERLHQKDYTPSEQYALGKKLEALLATPPGRPSAETVENCYHSEGGKTRDKVGAILRMSGKTWEKLKAVEESKYDDLKAQLEKGGKIDPIYRRFKRMQRADQAAEESQNFPLEQVLCADCRDVLPLYADNTFHSALFDPPFGIGFDYYGQPDVADSPEDYWNWFSPIYEQIVRVVKPGGLIAFWQSDRYRDYFGRWFGEWHPYYSCKLNAMIRGDFPYSPAVDIIVMQWTPGASPLVPVRQDRSYNWFPSTIQFGDELRGLHPCPRPLDLCETLVRNFTIDNALILDCFTGSGQIPLGVMRVGGGRRCVAIEQNRRFAQVAENRLRTHDELHPKLSERT